MGRVKAPLGYGDDEWSGAKRCSFLTTPQSFPGDRGDTGASVSTQPRSFSSLCFHVCSGSIQRVSSCEALGKRGGDSGAGDSELCISRLPFPHSHHLLQGYQEVRFNLVPSLIQMSRNFCRAALNWHECTWVCPYMECGCVLISLKRIQRTSVWLRLCVYIKNS